MRNPPACSFPGPSARRHETPLIPAALLRCLDCLIEYGDIGLYVEKGRKHPDPITQVACRPWNPASRVGHLIQGSAFILSPPRPCHILGRPAGRLMRSFEAPNPKRWNRRCLSRGKRGRGCEIPLKRRHYLTRRTSSCFFSASRPLYPPHRPGSRGSRFLRHQSDQPRPRGRLL
jgi:hypothetical protein